MKLLLTALYEWEEPILALLYRWWDVPPIITFSVGLVIGLTVSFLTLYYNSCDKCEYYEKEV